jgi:para-nitrobenzyl esterase
MESSILSRRSFLANAGLAVLALHSRSLYALASPASVTVRTPSGTLRGEQAGGVKVFRGVPFAEPPVGHLRFRAPVKVKRWTGERDAVRFGPAAMQPGEPGVEHSEDCLYLNLWAPSGKGPFPVYVWIHGGGFTGGHAFEPMYDGTALAEAGILCITVPYRLGVFGFLDMEPVLGAEYAGSANNALRDLMAALEWVQENIAAFGGDPSRVTVGGQSAGAKLTDILLGIPAARGLFHQAISESGGAERVATREASAAVARGFDEAWRAHAGKEAASLLTAPATSLIEVQREFLRQWPQHFPLRAEIDGTLLPRRPIETIAGGSIHGKRLLIGTTREESALFIGPHPVKDPGAADLGNMQAARFADVYRSYREMYPQMTDEQRRIRALTAEEYWVPSMRVADAHLKGGGEAWMYRLDFAESSGRLKGNAFHSLDVRLAWNRPAKDVENAAAEAELAEQMHHAWIAFLRGETPQSHGLPAWPKYRSDERPTMVLDTHSRVEDKPQEAELRLWDGVL